VLIASALGPDREGLVTLLADQTIVPFLWKEQSFQDSAGFPILAQGRAAIAALGGEPALSGITCFRLGGSDRDANELAADRLATRFRLELQQPLEMGDLRLRRVADALLDEPDPDEQTRAALAGRLREVAQWVRDNRPDRSPVYERFITYGDPTATGYRAEPFAFELKKWVDAVYNGNLPLVLGARTFTPNGMPTPLDLELSWATVGTGAAAGQADVAGALDDIVDRARRHAQLRAWSTLEGNLAIPLPAPHELSHLDLIEVRGWDTWRLMMAAMDTHLDRPLDAALMAAFWTAYDAFLRHLSRWWIARGRPERQRYAAGVARIFRYGDWFVGLVQLGNLLFPVLPAPSVQLPPFAEDVVHVTVETGLYLYQRAGVEWRRSQAVRGLQRQQRVEVGKLVQTWEAVQRLYPELADETVPGGTMPGGLAVEESSE
jgi:hypothetical protein